eukprot:1157621-Pelagomonas_calceolata.AAC.2
MRQQVKWGKTAAPILGATFDTSTLLLLFIHRQDGADSAIGEWISGECWQWTVCTKRYQNPASMTGTNECLQGLQTLSAFLGRGVSEKICLL